MKSDDLFTAPQVAKICSTDLKTIHNWVNRGEIKSFRTPGRHLRFTRQDILEFLSKFGYPIPDGFSGARKRVVLYETKRESLRAIKRSLAKDFDVVAFADHVDALVAIGEKRPSLVLVSGDKEQAAEAMHMVARLVKKPSNLPVAVYASDASVEREARGAGALDFILSVDGQEIRRRVNTVIGK